MESIGNIVVTGGVEDVRPFIRKAAVYVSAIKLGTGIKTKIIEALAMSKAIVATSALVQGLWEVGDSILISSNDQEFVKNTVSLLRDESLRKKYERKSQKLFNSSYALSKVFPLTINIYNQLPINR